MENINTKKKLLILLTNSFAATNIIHSGLITALASRFEIFISSSLLTEADVTKINRRFSIDVKYLDFDIPVETKRVKILRRLQKAFFFSIYEIETEKIRKKSRNFLLMHFLDCSVRIIKYLGLTNRILKALREKIIKYTDVSIKHDAFVHNNFHGIISTSPLDIRENILTNHLKKKGGKTFGMIISWDNLTSKGIINANHDFIFTWNKMMQEEYLKFYSLYANSTQEVIITGIPRFDIYFQDLPSEFSQDKFLKEFEFSHSDRIIFFATSAFRHFTNQTDIVDDLLEYAVKVKNTKVLVRCHPGDKFNLYEKYAKNPVVRIWHPQNISNNENERFYKWMPDLDNQYSLAAMLKYSDVCVNVASTIALDAAACLKPIISIAYDGKEKKPYKESVKRFYDYSHQIPLNSLGANKLVYSKEELMDVLDTFFQSKDWEIVQNHDKVIKEFCYYSEAKSVSSILNSIEECLS